MTVIYNMSIDRADKPWIGDRRLTELYMYLGTDTAVLQADMSVPVVASAEHGGR